MEVTRKNFDTVLSTLPDIFNKAQFLAFDTEFTGLKVEGANNSNYYDEFDDLYLKNRLKAETFMAIQFGIVAFFYDEKLKKYTHQGFNFYIYPSTHSDINFTCQSKSIEFLAKNGFDFNTLFLHGIPYLKDSEIAKHLDKLQEKHDRINSPENLKIIETPPEHSELINKILKEIDDILKAKIKKKITIEKNNSYIRKLIYSAVQAKYGKKVLLESNKDETMTVSVGYSSEEIKKYQEENFTSEKKNILKELGFTQVIKLMIDSKKLIVGHYLLLDILFTIRQFLSPLPNSYSEFKELLHFLFPKIIDTKYMVSTQDFKGLKDTSLPNVVEYFNTLGKIPDVSTNENEQGYNLSEKKLHEAAYDAYITGLAFLGISNSLGTSKVFENLPDSSFLKPYLNKLKIQRIFDIHCMNIGGKDAEPDRTGVYHLSFPKEWKREHISDLFANCGYISISWINDTSAFVKLNNEYLNEAKKIILNSNSTYKLRTYNDFRMLNNKDSGVNVDKKLKTDNVLNNSHDFSKNFDGKELSKKRQIEDVGEVVARPEKRKCTS